MNQTRRRANHRRSRKHGGANISPAPISYRTVSENPQPSERVMDWATTAGAPMPSAAEMRGVAHGGKRRKRCTRNRKHSRKHKCHCKSSCHCKGKCRCRPHCRCKCHSRKH